MKIIGNVNHKLNATVKYWLNARKMLFFKTRRSCQESFVCCYIVFSLVAINGGCPFACANPLTNRSAEYKSAVLKPAASPHASLPSALVQTSINPIIQKYAISDLTQDLNIQLKSIEEHELLIPAIQSVFDSLDRVPSSIDHNDTKILNFVASKIEAKLFASLRILNETNQKFLSILSENSDSSRKLLLDAIILPCSSPTKHSERSTHDSNLEPLNQNDFIAGMNKKKAIEVLNFLKNAGHLHETDDRNFTINKRLMETLKSIDLSTRNVPNTRDAFFLPRNSHGSSANCRNTVPNEHHRYNTSLLIDQEGKKESLIYGIYLHLQVFICFISCHKENFINC